MSPTALSSVETLVNRALGRPSEPLPSQIALIQRANAVREPAAAPIRAVDPIKPFAATDIAPARLFPAARNTPDRLIGQALNRYIIVESDDGIALIDQHAMHERIRFEAMKTASRSGIPDIQPALIPETVAVSPSQTAAFDELADAFASIGIDAEAVNDLLFIRSSPVGTRIADAAAAIVAMIDEYIDTGLGTADPFRLKERAIYWASCKGAIKAGEPLGMDRMQALLDEFSSIAGAGDWTCPHGRPIRVRIDNAWIEKQLSRDRKSVV